MVGTARGDDHAAAAAREPLEELVVDAARADLLPHEREAARGAVIFQAEDGIRDLTVTGVQTCALPISGRPHAILTMPYTSSTAPMAAGICRSISRTSRITFEPRRHSTRKRAFAGLPSIFRIADRKSVV